MAGLLEHFEDPKTVDFSQFKPIESRLQKKLRIAEDRKKKNEARTAAELPQCQQTYI